jgi:predicted amidohydrolase YtcJ
VTSTLLRNGRVLTPDGWASAVLVEDDRIAWVGNDDAGERTDHVIDLGGRLVTPAFVDAHVHLASTGFAALGADLSSVRSADEALDLLAAHAATSGLSVVLAHGWDESGWPGGRPITRRQLDEAVGARPAYVSRVDMHSTVASTALWEAATSLDAWRGKELDGWSKDGPLTRDAHHAVREAMNALLTDQDRRAAIRLALSTAARVGIGVVHEIGAPHISPTSDFDLIAELARAAMAEGPALPTVEWYWGSLDVDEAGSLGCLGAAGDLCVDGAIGSRTAALHEAYADDETRGYLYLTADQVADHIVACTEREVQAGFHVIGDRGVAEVVAGFRTAAERVGEQRVRDGAHRLEHLEMVTHAQLQELARLGVAASVQPVFDAWWGGAGGLYETRLGGRARGMNPYRSMGDVGMTMAFGSDSPVTPMDPWSAVRAAVHHHDDEQRIDARAALDAHTVGGWQTARPRTSDVPASHDRRLGGKVQEDAPAYLAVWQVDDGLANGPGVDLEGLVAPDRELPLCDLTIVAGRAAHDALHEWPTVSTGSTSRGGAER